MKTTLCLLLALLSPSIQDQENPGPGQEQTAAPTVEEARALLAEARDSKESGAILSALAEVGRTEDRELVAELGGLLKHKDPEVRAACLGALRFNAHGDVVPLLLKQARNKKLLGEPAAAEAYYYALGQSADPRALEVLGDGLRVTVRGDEVARARILALGRIRDPRSVEALMSLLVSGGGRRAHPQMSDLHRALTVLTGAEVRANRQDWQTWWNDNKRGLEVSPDLPELDPRVEKAWLRTWADPEARKAQEEEKKKSSKGKRGKRRDDSG